MYRPESSIIDNKTLKLFEEINKILKEQKSIDIASAYFNIAGFQLIKNSLTDTNKFRLLIGTTPETEDKKPDIFQPEVEYKRNFRKDLEDEPFERDKRETVESLIEFLKGDNAKVRLYDKGFLHGKAYIFDKLAIIGSSNFTYSGFTSNTELNAVLDEVYASYIKKEWFEKFWSESRDFKDEFLKIFDESKFGTKEYLPFDVFIKALYELQKDDINFEFSSIISTTGLPSSEVDLTNFQEDAVKRIYSRLKTYNGVLVADSVGLGKTWIAKKVIEDFGFYQRRKFLVICPASVDELLWRPALKDIGVSENIIHQEELGREDFSFESLEKELNLKLKDIALIVVDESHNFRNSNTNRFENLFTLIEKASELSKPKILLLTATPMNNSYWDFYFQLMLITQYNKSIFSKEGIFDLEKLFKKADRGNTKPLNDILQIISIRRTRQYIKDNYPDAEYKDKDGNLVKIKFPNRELFEINYSLNETYQGLYYKIAEKIEKELKLAYYRLEEYRTVGEIDKMALGRMKALAGILQIILLKRLESSIEAFRKSIQHQIDFLNTFKEFFNKGKVLKKKFYDKYIAYLEEEIDGEFQSSEELNKDLENINLFEFDKDKFLAHLDSDIETFGSIKKLIESIDEESDAKLRELKNKLIDLKDIGKILLFSSYADTIDYIYDSITKDKVFIEKFGKKIAKLTGSCSANKRKETIEKFLNADIDILLSTDILSEGQNLQKARIVINYDLHWNPVRMIQRAGRIDRIGSPHSSIYIHNFYPEKELESLLELVKILQGKIEMIDETIGLDASVLGETINPKVFGIIQDLKGSKEKKKKTLKELEEEQFGGGELFWQPLKDFGVEKLRDYCESIPNGIQSGLKKDKGIRGIFFYYKYDEDYHFWYLYDAINDKYLTNKTEILDFISCKKETPRIIPEDLDIFEIHNKVRDEIKKAFSENLIATYVRPQQGKMEKTLRDMREELDYIIREYIEEEDPRVSTIENIINSLNNITLTRKRKSELRRIWKNYKDSKNWHILIEELYDFFKDKPINNEREEETIKFEEEKLKLICADFIS
ncbi:MAG TPA: helicase-related protein [Caldisericia bacterium]|mgnify:FL=1|nr:helicase-related protein [Caldisericia bacterium]